MGNFWHKITFLAGHKLSIYPENFLPIIFFGLKGKKL